MTCEQEAEVLARKTRILLDDDDSMLTELCAHRADSPHVELAAAAVDAHQLVSPVLTHEELLELTNLSPARLATELSNAGASTARASHIAVRF